MLELKPIGVVRHDHDSVPRHWTISQLEGELLIEPQYSAGLADLAPGQRIIVLFHFHKSPPFSAEQHMRQTPPHRDQPKGVFSICSPVRPNPIGHSVVEVLAVQDGLLRVRGLDMLDGTPILDLKPYKTNGPSGPG